jgi:PIN domain nuclease of toxin-antitoxin system
MLTIDSGRPPVVLDASALLALLQGEEGADEVEGLLDGSLMSTVNLSEALQKAEQHGVDTEGLEYDLPALGVELVDFDVRSARVAAELWPIGRSAGLSLGDRACLALTRIMAGRAVTKDLAWAGLDLGDVEVQVLS